jgi:uncharacterized protein (DUF2236 family)
MFFVDKDSIVRRIWGKADTVLFIFAGSAAEFALNKAVDWLYFTGRLPADPLGRLFSTVAYAKQIIFSEESAALAAISKINSIHKNVEISRNAQIPDWAYRDVLFMLIDYSIRSFELLEREMTLPEKEEVFNVFKRVGNQMQLRDLPVNYTGWLKAREEHMRRDLMISEFTRDLYRQYKKRLGPVRYPVLKQVQALLVPNSVNTLLGFKQTRVFITMLKAYKVLRVLKLETIFKNILLPTEYKTPIQGLEM